MLRGQWNVEIRYAPWEVNKVADFVARHFKMQSVVVQLLDAPLGGVGSC